MYLLMGEKRAVLLDTGATAEADYFPLRYVIDQVLTRWQQANEIEGLELIVMPMGAAASQTAGGACTWVPQLALQRGTRAPEVAFWTAGLIRSARTY